MTNPTPTPTPPPASSPSDDGTMRAYIINTLGQHNLEGDRLVSLHWMLATLDREQVKP